MPTVTDIINLDDNGEYADYKARLDENPDLNQQDRDEMLEGWRKTYFDRPDVRTRLKQAEARYNSALKQRSAFQKPYTDSNPVLLGSPPQFTSPASGGAVAAEDAAGGSKEDNLSF